MTQPRKRTAATHAMVEEREKHKRLRKGMTQVEERGWESSEEEEKDVLPIGLQEPAPHEIMESDSEADTEEEIIVSEGEEEDSFDETEFSVLMTQARAQSARSFGHKAVLPYQRGTIPIQRHQHRVRQKQREMYKSMDDSQPLTAIFLIWRSETEIPGLGLEGPPRLDVDDIMKPESQENSWDETGKAIEELEKKLRSKRIGVTPVASTPTE